MELEELEQRLALASDSVMFWNGVALNSIRSAATPPPAASRALAIVHAAIFDAVNAIEHDYQAYRYDVVRDSGASLDAAVARAAHDTLSALFPNQQQTFDNVLAQVLSNIPDGVAEDQGVDIGADAALAILSDRLNDGSKLVVNYTPGNNPGDWQPTPPGFANPLMPQWPGVTPFGLTSGDQFRPGPPPSLDSVEYANALNEVKEIGSINSATRTPDQTAIAMFWANGPGTSTPPGHWNVIARVVAESQDNSISENARLFALLNFSLADAAIASWDAKYEFDYWRPVTAIRQADTDGNVATTADPTWTPYLVTPPFPSYTSGHSTFSGAGAAVLTAFFGDQVSFTLASETPAAGNRTFNSFWDAAEESGLSRIYGGIHYSFDNTAGLTAGAQVGEWVLNHLLADKPNVPQATLSNGELIVLGTNDNDFLRVAKIGDELIVTSGNQVIGSFAASLVNKLVLKGDSGNDMLIVDQSVVISADIFGGDGDDLLIAGGALSRLFGEAGKDLLVGTRGHQFDGGADRDNIFYASHNMLAQLANFEGLWKRYRPK